ncbi:MAG: cyclase dehydrase [Bradyrhizobium sp.]|nr:cyclase dehydrase [Bradyrhizobium sp.]
MPELIRQTALRGQSQSGRDRMAKSLGYLSIALGLAEMAAPKAICTAIGISGLETVVRAYGAREIATGVAILTSHNPEPWIWARVAGDMADIATVATGMQKEDAKKDNNMLALSALAAVTALDVVCASALGAEKGGRKTAIADYSDRTGFPDGLEAARGAARNTNAAAARA